jgi:hypothetical protein
MNCASFNQGLTVASNQIWLRNTDYMENNILEVIDYLILLKECYKHNGSKSKLPKSIKTKTNKQMNLLNKYKVEKPNTKSVVNQLDMEFRNYINNSRTCKVPGIIKPGCILRGFDHIPREFSQTVSTSFWYPSQNYSTKYIFHP